MAFLPSVLQKLGRLVTSASHVTRLQPNNCLALAVVPSSFHTSALAHARYAPGKGEQSWKLHNEKVFPPQKPDEERRPAYVCHFKTNIRGNYKRMWYQATFIQGMSIDEALKQLSFSVKGFTALMKEILLEAQEMAVRDHGVEYKSNLWIAESFVGKGQHIKGMRRHGRMRMGEVRYQYNHYYVKLEEGSPPKFFYKPKLTGEEMLEKWMQRMRDRHVDHSI